MSRRRASLGSLFIIGVLALAIAAPPAAAAGPAGQIYFGRNDGQQLVIGADGSGMRVVPCAGERTHQGMPRRVLRIEPTDATFPAYYPTGRLIQLPTERVVATDESCLDAVLLANLPSGYDAVAAAWSLDDTRVALSIARYDATGQLLDQGIWVGEVDASCGTALCGLRLAVTLPMVPSGDPDSDSGLTPYLASTPASISWSPDGRRVTYDTPNSGIFVADLGPVGDDTVRTPTLVPVTAPVVKGSAVVPRNPSFSPILGDDRIAFAMITAVKSCWRSDIFTVRPAGGAPTRITTATNGICELSNPAWSPDAQWLAFDAWPGSLATNHAIYRIRADGSGKYVQVTPASSSWSYRGPVWRL